MALEKKQYFLIRIYGCSNAGVEPDEVPLGPLQHTHRYNPTTECSLRIRYRSSEPVPHPSQSTYHVIMENCKGELSHYGYYDRNENWDYSLSKELRAK